MFWLAVALQSTVLGVVSPCTANTVTLNGRSDLRVVCGRGNGARIGEVDSYEAVANRITGALVVRATLRGETRIFLVVADEAGRPGIQDITRDAARAAGHYADLGSDTVVDLATFADNPSIGVTDRHTVKARTSQLNLSRPMEMARTGRAVATAPVEAVNP